ncbi:MAG: peptidase S8, partial [Acidobacteriota bacterium]
MNLRQKKISAVLVFLLLGLFSLSLSRERSQEGRFRKKATDSPRRELRTFDGTFRFERETPSYAEGQVLLKFKPEVHSELIEATIAIYGATKLKKISQLNVYLIKFTDYYSVQEMVGALRENPDVEYAEPNFTVRLAVHPNDPLFSYQYALNNTGQDIGLPGSPHGKARADIRAIAGWEETTG